MSDANLQTTNILLTILTVACLLQLLVLIAYGIVGYQTRRQVQAELAVIRHQVDPLIDLMTAVLTDVRYATTRVNSQIDRVDRVVDGASNHLGRAAAVVGPAFWGRTWLVLAAARGLGAAIRAFRGSPSSRISGRR